MVALYKKFDLVTIDDNFPEKKFAHDFRWPKIPASIFACDYRWTFSGISKFACDYRRSVLGILNFVCDYRWPFSGAYFDSLFDGVLDPFCLKGHGHVFEHVGGAEEHGSGVGDVLPDPPGERVAGARLKQGLARRVALGWHHSRASNQTRGEIVHDGAIQIGHDLKYALQGLMVIRTITFRSDWSYFMNFWVIANHWLVL